jgi:hypothetical protein
MSKHLSKSVLACATGLAIGLAGYAIADAVHDWRDLFAVHEHVAQAIHEMERAQKANHYDMSGHATKAEELLRAAE